MPNQHDPAPRFGLAYDLFGTGKTALKYSINRYNASRTTGDANSGAQRYNPLARTSVTLNWTDVNKDDIAQGELGCVYLQAGCEIDLSGLPSNFGFRALTTQDPNIARTWDLEQGVEIQHELLPRISVTASYYHGTFHDICCSATTATSRPRIGRLSGVQSDRRHADDDLRLRAGARRHGEAGARRVRHDLVGVAAEVQQLRVQLQRPAAARARRCSAALVGTGCLKTPVPSPTIRTCSATATKRIPKATCRPATPSMATRFRSSRTESCPERCRSRTAIQLSGSFQSNMGYPNRSLTTTTHHGGTSWVLSNGSVYPTVTSTAWRRLLPGVPERCGPMGGRISA